MSDHDDLDTMDLDALCRGLLSDVETRTHARGADLAIRTAAHRRRNSAIGGILVVLVVLAGVLIGTLGLPLHRPALPAAPPSASSDNLPKPQALSAATLDAATDGWLTGWQREPSPSLADLRCLPKDRVYPESVSQWGSEFVIGTKVRATQTGERFASAEQAERAYDGLTNLTADCYGGGIVFGGQGTGSWDSSLSFFYTYESNGSMAHAFVACYEDKVTLLTIVGGVDRPSALVEDRVVRDVIDALVADMRA